MKMIQLRKTLQTAHDVLKKNNIQHALIGGLALAVYCKDSRSTADIDLLADGSKKNEIKTALESVGFILKFESSEVLQFAGAGFLDILLAHRDLTKKMLELAELKKTFDVQIVRAEDIIGLKIQAYKNDPSREFQDKADIQKLLSTDNLNYDLIKMYSELFSEWEVIQNMITLIKKNTNL